MYKNVFVATCYLFRVSVSTFPLRVRHFRLDRLEVHGEQHVEVVQVILLRFEDFIGHAFSVGDVTHWMYVIYPR